MAETVVINTKLGRLRGSTKLSRFSGQKYYAFQGIPYAKPPVGELRFKAPLPFGSWEGIRDALDDGYQAVQPILLPLPGINPEQNFNGNEDCLTLNIYTNELPNEISIKTPVMVWIHGGAFLCGSGVEAYSGPDYLLEGNVIVVSINYRLGAFGFLSLENEVVSGNAGLKDQTLALNWVNENIESFGGDPYNVTIFGISAGGASVNYHLLSPSSAGLFHKAILQSGFSTNPWAVQKQPRESAVKLARQLGCLSDSDKDILEFLQSVSPSDIVDATKAIGKSKDLMATTGLLFVPCIESTVSNAFLTEDPYTLMRSGKFNQVPVILGGTVKEGSVVAFFGALNDEEFENINKNPEVLIPSIMKHKEINNKREDVCKEIWNFYLKGNLISWDNVNDFLVLRGDLLFNYGLESVRDSLLERSSKPVYRYLFTNHSKCICSLVKLLIKNPDHYSKVVTSDTCHGADGSFLILNNFLPLQLSDEDRQAIKKHVSCWAAFAKNGDPNWRESDTVWLPDTLDKPCYMDIGTQWTMKDGKPFASRIDFLKSLVSKCDKN